MQKFMLPILLGLRAMRGKTRRGYISFISTMSLIGITLGVMILITVLSVMNGFSLEVKKHLFRVAQHMTITSRTGSIEAWQELRKKVLAKPGIQAAAPFTLDQALIGLRKHTQPAYISGVLPQLQNNIDPELSASNLDKLKPAEFNVLLNQDMAGLLHAGINQKLVLITPHATHSVLGVTPRFKRVTLRGSVATSPQSVNSQIAWIHLADAQALFKHGKKVSGLRLRVANMDDTPKLAAALRDELGPSYRVHDWTESFHAFFKAIQLEKTMMLLILLFIIIVAVFNLLSSLVMLVTDKRGDIAILRTIGMSPRGIVGIFITQGMTVGCLGTCLGTLGGCLLSRHVSGLVRLLEHVLHRQIMAPSVYMLDYLPAELQWQDVIMVVSMTLVLCLFATLYPAYKAAQVQPAKVLRYE